MVQQGQPRLRALFWSFARIGGFTIGGGYAMVPMIRTELVQSRRWVSDGEFAEMLCLAQTAPGMLAVNTALLAGFRLRGLSGALTACLGAILPSFLIILLISSTLVQLQELPLVERIFRGMRPAIAALLASAVIKMGRSILLTWRERAAAAALFLLAILANPHPALLILGAGLAGACLRGGDAEGGRAQEEAGGMATVGVLWTLTASFFLIGALTFGGGYAMIPLMQREIISAHRWLSAAQFLDIVAIAEMTPGPIAVNAATFVGYRVAGILGSAAATFGVTMPSILVVLVMARVFYRCREEPAVQRALTGMRSAVIALIAAAVLTVARSSIHAWQDAFLAGAVLAVLLGTRIHPVLALIGAGAAGAVLF